MACAASDRCYLVEVAPYIVDGAQTVSARFKMWQTIVRFGSLATVILLLVVVGEYALFLKPKAASWIAGGSALALLATGLWLGRMVFRRRDERARFDSPARPASDDAPVEAIIEALGVSPREYEVLRLVADGLSNQQIANRLYISESTVKTHVSNLLVKLDAQRRTHAVRRARQAGLIR